MLFTCKGCELFTRTVGSCVPFVRWGHHLFVQTLHMCVTHPVLRTTVGGAYNILPLANMSNDIEQHGPANQAFFMRKRTHDTCM